MGGVVAIWPSLDGTERESRKYNVIKCILAVMAKGPIIKCCYGPGLA